MASSCFALIPFLARVGAHPLMACFAKLQVGREPAGIDSPSHMKTVSGAT